MDVDLPAPVSPLEGRASRLGRIETSTSRSATRRDAASLATSRATKPAAGAARLLPAGFLGVFLAFLTALYAQVEPILPPEYQ
jgi:hypothetical protein